MLMIVLIIKSRRRKMRMEMMMKAMTMMMLSQSGLPLLVTFGQRSYDDDEYDELDVFFY